VSAPQALPEHGVTVVFVELPNTKVELLEPLGEGSPIAAFLEKNPSGGMHHICYEVAISSPPATTCAGRREGAWGRESQRPAPMASRCSSCTRRTSSAR
jgi:hypothetical protein